MKADAELDISGETCPMTFVRTKVKLEGMRPGELLRVRLRAGEPLANVPRAVLDHVAELLETPKIRVYEVASFYDMFNTEPTGRVQVRVCTTTPCWLRGSDEIVRACKDALGIEIGENTEDGRFFLREFECLGACCNAPMMWIDDHFYEDLDYGKAKEIVEAIMRGETPEPGPQSGRKGSEPLGQRTTLLEDEA